MKKPIALSSAAVVGLALFVGLLSGCGSSQKGPAGSATSASGVGDGTWQEFNSEPGKFTVLLPGTPIDKDIVGNTSTKTYSLTYNDLTYLITSTEMAAVSQPKDDKAAAELIDNFFSTMPITEGVQIKGQYVPVKVAGHPGGEVTFTTNDKTTGRVRLCVADGRMYRLQVTGTEDAVKSADAGKFLDSLRVN